MSEKTPTFWELLKFMVRYWYVYVGVPRLAMMVIGAFLIGNQLGIQVGAGALLLAIAVTHIGPEGFDDV